MTCGCSDNKNIGNKNFSSDGKSLNIEDMKDMTIDDIVRLYQDGYKIETMQYGTYCSGNVVQDRSILDASSNSANLNIYTAYAQKVMPTSKCLKNVVLKLTRVSDVSDIFVEIRPHNTSTGFPQGDPQTSGRLGYYRVPITSIPTSPTDITAPLDLLLSDTNITDGIWIVVSLWIYDPTIPDSTVYAVVGNGVSGTVNEHMAFKDNGLPWQGSNSWNLYFKTNKQAYAIPCPTPAISVTCPTSPIVQGTTGNITATITTAGTPNYTYKLYVDSGGSPVDTYGPTSVTSHTFSHVFNESGGSHTYRVDVVDSCPTGAKTVTNNCTATIAACPTPAISITCPSSPINQGSVGSIIATVTTVGTPNYTYKLYVDSGGSPVDTYGPTSATSYTFAHTFSESGGPHTYRVDVVDSCTTPGAKTATNSCTVTISVTGCPTPVISIVCPTSPVTQGTTGNITATITTAGTPNYTYKLYVDSGGSPVDIYGPTSVTSHTFSHVFNESGGSHTYRVDVVDSCSTPKTATNSCTLNVQSTGGCPVPVVSVTCPGSITQGLTGNIAATITAAGTPNYTYKLYRDSETIPIDTFGPTPNASYTFSHLFNESVGAHTFKVEVTDSCTVGALITIDICSTTILESGVTPSAGMGAGVVIIAVAAAAALVLAARKPPGKPPIG